MEEHPMKDNPDRRQRSKPKKAKRLAPALLERIKPNAAGVDCGSAHHHVAVPVDRDAEPIRRFKTLTPDLYRLADWLEACGIETVAMEATGVYWIPIYEILEERGLEVVLVNARHVKNVPGRKTDVVDCQWIQELHSLGLLRGSFRPSAEIASLRAYLRHREKLVQDAANHIRRMQKSLVLMNVQLHNVIADITGKTGMQIVRDIASGATDPIALASHRDPRCRASEEEIAASLTGNYRREHVFVLRQNLELYDSYQRQIGACDGEIESLLQDLAAKQDLPETALPAARRRHRLQKNDPRFEIRSPLHRLSGADITQIDALGPYTALRLISEIGIDMTCWPTERHFTSWLTLAPKNKITGGRLISSKTQPSANRAAAMLRMCAMSVGKTSTALGAYYRRIAYRIGKAKAITATARKIAILVYRVLRGDIDYSDPGAEAYEDQHRTRTLRNLRKRAQQLGLSLIDLETGELMERGVS
jgi:transposase